MPSTDPLHDLKRQIVAAITHRKRTGRHLHHRDCIHNLSPEDQIAVRGKTVEQWLRYGPMPEQITADQWECEPPILEGDDHAQH